MWRIICICTVESAALHDGDLVQVTLNKLLRAGGGGWLGFSNLLRSNYLSKCFL